jgi:hypothetical protein
MTLEELQSLTEREIDALVAEKVMGWKLYRGLKDIPRRVEDVDEWPFCIIFDGYVMKQNDRRVTSQWSVAFAPSSDLNLAAQVEEKVIEKAGPVRFGNLLADIIGLCPLGGVMGAVGGFDLAKIARATARQRVIACLLAWESV